MNRLAITVAASVALLSATSAAFAEPTCEAHPGDALPAETDIVWRGDLDGDGHRRDVIVRYREGCGAHECMFEAFVRCRDGTFASVMTPEYGDKVRVRRPARRGWARIQVRVVGESRDPRERYLWVSVRPAIVL